MERLPVVAKARIYRPARTAMQQGRAKTHAWVLEFAPAEPRRHDPLMGWVGSGDTSQQVRLRFPTREEAIAYAERNDIPFEVFEPHEPTWKIKSYAENFRWSRRA